MSSQTFRSSALVSALVIGAALLPVSLRAQQGAVDRGNTGVQGSNITTSAPTASADVAPAAGPRVAPAGITKPVAANPLGLAEPQPQGGAHLGAGSNLALMGVGAAGLIVGLMIGGNGGTLLALGGGVIGLVGLYRYLK